MERPRGGAEGREGSAPGGDPGRGSPLSPGSLGRRRAPARPAQDRLCAPLCSPPCPRGLACGHREIWFVRSSSTSNPASRSDHACAEGAELSAGGPPRGRAAARAVGGGRAILPRCLCVVPRRSLAASSGFFCGVSRRRGRRWCGCSSLGGSAAGWGGACAGRPSWRWSGLVDG